MGRNLTKNDGSNKNQFYSQSSCSEGLKVVNNDWDYFLYLNTDWESMTEPYIKVYVKDDETSKTASLQFAYIDQKGNNEVWNDRVDYQSTDNWIEKCIKLNKKNLDKYKVLLLSSGNGFTVTKIEIYDLATK